MIIKKKFSHKFNTIMQNVHQNVLTSIIQFRETLKIAVTSAGMHMEQPCYLQGGIWNSHAICREAYGTDLKNVHLGHASY